MTAAGTATLLTPAGVGAIAVVRLDGPGVGAFAEAHLSKPLRTSRCVHCDLRDGDETVDDVVALQTPDGPLDLNVHGGPWVVRRTLRLAEQFGFAVTPWPSTPAAVDADDAIERQVLLDLPSARTAAVLRLLTAQPAAWRAMLASPDARAMRRAIDDTSLARALTVPTVAIVGPPNVGKSTLANRLFGRDRSIVADSPGTTRDWVGEEADLGGVVVRLIDTPGVRTTDDAIEAAAIDRAGGVTRAADCVVLAVDGSRPMTADERGVVRQYRREMSGRSLVVVRTKWDLVAKAKDATARALEVSRASEESTARAVASHTEGRSVGSRLSVSARTGSGIDPLRRLLRHAVGVTDIDTPDARCWTDAQRYKLRGLLETAAASIDRP